MKLPDMTILVLKSSHWTGMYWYLAVPLLGALDAAILFFLRRRGENAKSLAGVWVVCVLLAVILMMALVIIGLTAPLIPVINLSK